MGRLAPCVMLSPCGTRASAPRHHRHRAGLRDADRGTGIDRFEGLRRNCLAIIGTLDLPAFNSRDTRSGGVNVPRAFAAHRQRHANLFVTISRDVLATHGLADEATRPAVPPSRLSE